MKNNSKLSVIILCVFAFSLAGCNTTGNKQTIGTIGGGAAGGVAGGLLGSAFGGKTGAIVGAVAGSLLGGVIGNEIGRQLDAEDRRQASVATKAALASASTQVTRAPAPKKSTVSPSNKTRVQESLQTSEPRKKPAVKVKSAPRVQWESKKNEGVKGSAQVVDAEVDTTGRECRTVREIAYISGEEVSQETQYCRNPSASGWIKAA